MKQLNLVHQQQLPNDLDDKERILLAAVSRAMIVDVETTVKNTIGNNKASPYCHQNWMVLGGFAPLEYPTEVKTVSAVSPYTQGQIELPTATGKVAMFVGHNLKFDMNWIRRYGLRINKSPDFDLNKVFYPEGAIWDTQIAEYLLSAQEHKFPKLDDLMAKYNLPRKDDYFKDAWARGEQTEDMDKVKLGDYLRNDVTGTGNIARAQMNEAVDRDMLDFIASQMMASMAVHEMENNGIFISTNVLGNIHSDLKSEMDTLTDEIYNLISTHAIHLTPAEVRLVNLNSNQHLAALLFGGTVKYKKKVQDGFYKNGKPKMRLQEFEMQFNQAVDDKFKEHTPSGQIRIDAKVLQNIKDAKYTSSYANLIVKKLLRVKELSKQIGTYCEGLGRLVDHAGIVHHTIHETRTATGRRSSANPNGQNIPSHESSDIKKAFRSRWGDDGYIVEADYSQLEVIGLAFLSRDKQLMYDVSHGVDIHTETGKIVFGHQMSKNERRIAKVINFGLIYGGGAAVLADQAGVSTQLAKQLINAFYKRYPDVKVWQKEMQEHVESLATYQGDQIEGMPVKRSVVASCTGRRYLFIEEMYKGKPGFSPTKIKNYFVQGLATGDIVPLVMGHIFKRLVNDDDLRDYCLMVNTVHDSIIFDCHVSVIEKAIPIIKEIMESAPSLLDNELGVSFDLPLKVEVEAGPSWGELQKVV